MLFIHKIWPKRQLQSNLIVSIVSCIVLKPRHVQVTGRIGTGPREAKNANTDCLLPQPLRGGLGQPLGTFR